VLAILLYSKYPSRNNSALASEYPYEYLAALLAKQEPFMSKRTYGHHLWWTELHQRLVILFAVLVRFARSSRGTSDLEQLQHTLNVVSRVCEDVISSTEPELAEAIHLVVSSQMLPFFGVSVEEDPRQG
jgi:hypothetical protein